ncbi:transposase family protein [Streptomyces sp. NPDC054796]
MSVLVVSVDSSGPVVIVRARTRARAPAGCTGCGTPSKWIHSRYKRQLADAAVGGRPVRIDLSVRRLYCENSACPKQTFAEQVPGLTVRYQRRTPLLQQVVEAVGILLAGRGGARMLQVIGVALSRCTVLSQLMRAPLPPLVTPRALGVDDFALYGDSYGTLTDSRPWLRITGPFASRAAAKSPNRASPAICVPCPLRSAGVLPGSTL